MDRNLGGTRAQMQANGVSAVSVCMVPVFHGLLFGEFHNTLIASVTGTRTKTPPIMNRTNSTPPISYMC